MSMQEVQFSQRLEDRRSRRQARRDERDQMLDQLHDYEGRYLDLAERLLEDTRGILLAEPLDVKAALVALRRLGVTPVMEQARGELREALEQAHPLTEQAIRYARRREARPDEDRPYDGACKTKTQRQTSRRRRQILESDLKCPRCDRVVTSSKGWYVPTSGSGEAICLRCRYEATGRKSGRKPTATLPTDMVCPGCKRKRPERRMWALTVTPTVCKRCNDARRKEDEMARTSV